MQRLQMFYFQTIFKRNQKYYRVEDDLKSLAMRKSTHAQKSKTKLACLNEIV